MKNYLNILLAVLIVIMLFLTGYLINKVIEQKAEIDRLDNNQTVLNDSVRHYKTKSGLQAVSVQQLEYTIKDLTRFRQQDKDLIKDLNLKLKQVQSIQTNVTEVKVHDTIPMRDTVILGDSVQCFKKFDNYLKIIGCVKNNKVDFDLQHIDTCKIIPHWTYKKWFIFKFKTDVIRVEVVNKSPYSKIIYTESIKMK